MKHDSIFSLAYSPTKTTEKVVRAIVEGYGGRDGGHYDLTLPPTRSALLPPFPDCVTVIGVPVYAGRVPDPALDFLKSLRGNGQPVVPVVVYGNRHYDDALIELRDLLVDCGFRPVASGAFVGEHSFSTDQYPTAVGRPDEEDLKTARAFGNAVRKLMDEGKNLQFPGEPEIPGNRPYREKTDFPAGGPTADENLCIRCGCCASSCPVGAIDPQKPTETDGELCTYCCACIKVCPTGARSLEGSPLSAFPAKMAELCVERREPELFFPHS